MISASKTGNSYDFSEKLKISRSALFEYLSIMKQNGAPIIWNKKRNTYMYIFEGHFNIRFVAESESTNMLDTNQIIL